MIKVKMVVGLVVFMQLILQLSASSSTSSTQTDHYSEPCVRWCGEVEIPYPFGTTESCSLDSNFLIECNNYTYSDSPIPETGNVEVNSISVQHHEMSILFYVSRDCYNESDGCSRCQSPSMRNISTARIFGDNSVSLMVSPIFTISPTKNKLTVIGCDSYAYLHGYQNSEEYSMGCMSICQSMKSVPNGTCSGVGCCQTQIPHGLQNVSLKAYSFNEHRNSLGFNNCSYAFLVQEANLLSPLIFLPIFHNTGFLWCLIGQ